MCSCNTSSRSATLPAAAALSFKVEDMSCGHCAGTIKQAIETALPGTTVDADSVSKLVSVSGSHDYAAIKSIVSDAGYTAGAALS